jgi:sulfite exporter TauE/SafE
MRSSMLPVHHFAASLVRMDHMSDIFICGVQGPPSVFLIGTLAVAGLIGSFTHCAGMCGPFVLAQNGPDQFTLRRIGQIARLPYHAGRATTYTVLGAVAGGIGGQAASLPGFRWLSTILLLLAALLFLGQLIAAPLPGALSRWTRGFGDRLGRSLARLTRPLLQGTGWLRGYLLGIVLGFLPCGLLYGALTAAAGAGSLFAGAAAMAAFAASTATALILIGFGASALTRRWRSATQWIAKPFQLANVVMLAALAVNLWTRMPAH